MENTRTAVSLEEGTVQAEPYATPAHTATRGHPHALASALQETVDLESLVAIFAGEIRALVPCEGIEYTNKQHNVRILQGELRRHQCGYTLKLEELFLGQVLFTRGKRFNKGELRTLESLLSGVLFPLRKALQYREARRPRPDVLSGQRFDRNLESPNRSGARAAGVPGSGLGAAPQDSPELSLAPLGAPLDPTPAEQPELIDTGHLSLVTGEGCSPENCQRPLHSDSLPDTSHLSLEELEP